MKPLSDAGPEGDGSEPTRLRGILSLDRDFLAERITTFGGRAFHADSLRGWAVRRGATSFSEVTDLPKVVLEALAEEYSLLELQLDQDRRAPDGTKKLLLRLLDGETVETVWMPNREAPATVCISTQVGCPMACQFCASGLAGVVRNLKAHEIVEQVVHAKLVGPVGRIVVMGIGEPTLNLDAVLPALDFISSPQGLAISARKITISTIGIPDKIRLLAKHPRPYTLAVSLHAPDDALRHKLIPTTAKTTISELLDATKELFAASGREVTYEYVLLAGVNDSTAQAYALVDRLKEMRGCVNLIPYNPVPQTPFKRPSPAAVDAFKAILVRCGIPATIRWSKGLEADAACGQLRIRNGQGA